MNTRKYRISAAAWRWTIPRKQHNNRSRPRRYLDVLSGAFCCHIHTPFDEPSVPRVQAALHILIERGDQNDQGISP